MEKQDILDMLDKLDIQLVTGKIEQGTYNEIKQKLQERLQSFGGASSTSSLATLSPLSNPPPPSPRAEVLKCPACGGAADMENLPQDMSKPIPCRFCGIAYTLQQSQNDGQKLKQELLAWLDQKVLNMSGAGVGTVDAGTRSFIFSKDLYPDLKKDVDRRLENIENAPEAPMIPFRALATLSDYQPNPLLVAVGQGNNQWLKTLSTRLSAQQVQDFATTEGDKQRIQMLQFRVATLIYYANIAHLSGNGEIPSYHIVRQNILALQKDYQAYAGEVGDESYKSYLLALEARLSGVLLLLDVLIPIQERSFAPEAALAQIERGMNQLAKAEQQALTCTYNPLYTVPLQQGIQKDMMVARIFSAIMKCYASVLSSRPIEFPAFFHHILHYAHSLITIQSAAQLLGLLQSIERMLAGRAGAAPLPVLSDWSWLDVAIEGNRRKPTFGAAETVSTVIRHYHPYWVATLKYAEKQGVIFTKGTGREALILVDATSVNAPVLGCVLANDPLLPTIYNGINTYNLLDKQLMALPALISYDMAERAMKQYTSQHAAQLGATIVEMKDLIYIPVAYVQYTGKKQGRDMLIGRLNFVNQDLTGMLTQTHQFLQQYGA